MIDLDTMRVFLAEVLDHHHDRRGPDSDAETLAFFANYVGKLTKTREDIKTWADLLDLDDYVTFGGKV